MIIRKDYLAKIRAYIGKSVIKAITGLRRVGKSIFVQQIIEELRHSHIQDNQIIYIDKESLEFDSIRNYQDLQQYVAEHTQGIEGKIYVFVDEIQDIEQWEKTVASWSGRPKRYDITITGSNSTMFSGELATKLTGRYIEFCIYPLSLLEFKNFYPELSANDELFAHYLKFGGMPGLRMFEHLNTETAYAFLNSIHDSILLKDVVRRKAIRNTALLESVCDFCYDNIGNPITASSIVASLKKQRINATVPVVINYLQALKEAKLFCSPKRYDIKGKKRLEVSSKFYATDLGFRYAKIGFQTGDMAQLIENVVYMELLRRYEEVYVGNMGGYEVDFVAIKQAIPTYYQVTLNANSPQTLERENRPLLAIADNYPKYLISAEKIYGNDYQGIQILSLQDFLQGK